MTASERRWTFFTNHGHTLMYLARQPDARVRDIAAGIGITERATQGILSDLIRAGYVTATKSGRRNSYRIDLDRPFRHPIEAGPTVGDVLSLFTGHPGEADVSRPLPSPAPS